MNATLETAAQQRLLRLLRPNSSDEIGAVAPPEWPPILAAAAAQRLVPLLGRAIRNAGAEGEVPESVRVAVREATVATASANLRRSRALGRLLAALEPARIPVIVLKGLALAELVYRDVALRPMSDVDVLVGDSDFDAAVQILFAAGFASNDFDPAIGARGHACHIHLSDPVEPCAIELHWRLSLPTEAGQIDVDEVWSRSRPVRLAAGPALVLATEDLLLSLAEHVAKHRFARGSLGLFDIDETVRRHSNEIAWHEVVERARRWGVARSAYVSFWLAQVTLGTPVPDEVTTALGPGDFDSRVADLFQAELMSAGAASDADGHFGTVQFWHAKGAAARARLLWQSLFPPRQLAAQLRQVPANSPGVYLYYLARPFQMLARNGRFALRLAVGRASVTGAASRRAAIAEWLGRRYNPPMGHLEHKAASPASVRCYILTISDTRTEATDTSGRAIFDLLVAEGHQVAGRRIVRDEPAEVRAVVEEQLASPHVQAILMTGGTGITSRDTTFETIDALVEKRLDGFGELFRMLSYQEIGSAAMLSRASAGLARGKLLISMPGSEPAVRLAMTKLVLPELGHLVREAGR